MSTIIKTATSRGQITLPSAWRKQFNTNSYLIQENGKELIIKPIDVNELGEKEGEVTVFDAEIDNNGKELSGSELLSILKKIDG